MKTDLIKLYSELDFITVDKENIIVNPKVLEVFTPYDDMETLQYEFRHQRESFIEKAKKLKSTRVLTYLLFLSSKYEILTDECMDEFYYHSSLLDRIKNGALDDTMLRESNAYNELLGSIFAIPIHINYDSKIVNYGIEKIEIPKRKTQIESELDSEFARGILLYQALNDPLKESKEERLEHSSWAGHLTALKHYFKITDPNFKFTGDSLKQMIEEYEARETKEYI